MEGESVNSGEKHFPFFHPFQESFPVSRLPCPGTQPLSQLALNLEVQRQLSNR